VKPFAGEDGVIERKDAIAKSNVAVSGTTINHLLCFVQLIKPLSFPTLFYALVHDSHKSIIARS
jgi:hypothetical protein